MANNHFDLDVEVKAVNPANSSFGFTAECFSSQCFSSKCFSDTCFSSDCFTGRHQCGYTRQPNCRK
ncbi:elgicin/penisin family lantibiotic [Paenibacillus sp. MZ04-78.2]|uniref:elgicin/penisin family lantibiotic n=1 Tax=Paenibacillus sp. MZ04-78.2 TaxID=2962034 RepID=UPI0035CA2D01